MEHDLTVSPCGISVVCYLGSEPNWVDLVVSLTNDDGLDLVKFRAEIPLGGTYIIQLKSATITGELTRVRLDRVK